MGKICAFTGHRDLTVQQTAGLRPLLAETIARLYDEGYTDYLCGGAMGFDLLAAEAVLSLQADRPDLRLHLLLPCPEHCRYWPAEEQVRYQAVESRAYLVRYTAGHYYRGCMLVRDRALAEAAELCLCWLTRSSGGTAYTVRQCAKRDLPVINLADRLRV